MQDYYRTLDLPKGASEEQIKAQYRLLVRVYHPDRFTKPDDKSYAEQKIKEINEAYNALVRTVPESEAASGAGQPMPVVIPAFIDFGALLVGEKKTIALTVSNARGEIEDLQFEFSDANWFTLNENRMLTDNSSSPLQFNVVVSTAEMAPGRTYKGWIDVRMKNNVTRVNLSMKVVREQIATSRLGTIVRNFSFGIGLLALATGAAYYGPQLTSSTPNNNSSNQNSGVSSSAVKAPAQDALQIAVTAQEPAPQAALRGRNPLLDSLVIQESMSGIGAAFSEASEHLVYPIFDQNELVLYTSTFDGTSQERFKFTGQNIAWSKDGSRIAYLQTKEGSQQIFVAQSADRIEDQLTNTPNQKSDLIWAPDGSQLAYVQIEEGRRILYLTTPGGRSPRALSNPQSGSVGAFSWSPDSRILLFDVESESKRLIYQVNADGSGLKQFTSLAGYDPAWSPDGQRVLIGTAKGLIAFDKEGKQVRQFNTVASRLPRWSSDGTQFAFLELLSGASGNSKLLVTDLSGSKTEQLASGDMVNFEWSPTSNRIAYLTGKISSSKLSTLYLWTVLPGERAKLVAETNDQFVTWVP